MIRRARKDGREASGNEEREQREEREKRQFEEEEGPRDPHFIEFSRSDPTMWQLFLEVLRV